MLYNARLFNYILKIMKFTTVFPLRLLVISASLILASCGGSSSDPDPVDPVDTAAYEWSQWSPASNTDTSVIMIMQTRTATLQGNSQWQRRQSSTDLYWQQCRNPDYYQPVIVSSRHCNLGYVDAN